MYIDSFFHQIARVIFVPFFFFGSLDVYFFLKVSKIEFCWEKIRKILSRNDQMTIPFMEINESTSNIYKSLN